MKRERESVHERSKQIKRKNKRERERERERTSERASAQKKTLFLIERFLKEERVSLPFCSLPHTMQNATKRKKDALQRKKNLDREWKSEHAGEKELSILSYAPGGSAAAPAPPLGTLSSQSSTDAASLLASAWSSAAPPSARRSTADGEPEEEPEEEGREVEEGSSPPHGVTWLPGSVETDTPAALTRRSSAAWPNNQGRPIRRC